MPRIRVAPSLLLAFLATPLPAQTTLQPGGIVTGQLTLSDPQFRDSTRFHRFVVPVGPGRTVTVDLASDDFDPYLILERGGGEPIARSDDGGGGCNARVVYRAPDDRPLIVVVNTAGRGQTGRYTLRVSEGVQPLEPRGPCRFREAATGPSDTVAGAGRRLIAVGQIALGTVTPEDRRLPSDSTYAQVWEIEGVAGQTVTIDLQSDEFDPFLYLDGPGIGRPLQDDDSGGRCNARLTTTFPRTGTYTIVVNTAVRNATGQFTLSVTAGSKAASLARCARVQ